MVIKVGVLRGGPSSEHEVSLKTGESVISNLSDKNVAIDIFIDKNGDWYCDKKISQPERILRSVDVVFNALHGHFGEDGKVQQLLEFHGIPYTGSGVMASALGMNKIMSRNLFKESGLNIPYGLTIEKGVDLHEAANMIFRKIGPAWVVKPARSGSSVGISVAHNINDLIKAIDFAFSFDDKIIVEEFIKGREATCGIIENFRDEEHYALPAIEIIPPQSSPFFDYKAKYGGKAREICPGNFSPEIKKEIERMAKIAHNTLGCKHYSRADFIVSPRNKIYILEVNTLPGLTKESLLPGAISAIGASYPDFLDHLIALALQKN